MGKFVNNLTEFNKYCEENDFVEPWKTKYIKKIQYNTI